MALNQRRVKILDLIREDGHAKVQELRQRTLFQIMENLIVLLTMWTNFMKEML